jgi:acid phosphatase type 7
MRNYNADPNLSKSDLDFKYYSLFSDDIEFFKGFETTSSKQLILVPYLQTPTPNSIYVCWHDSNSTLTEVEFGTTSSLGQSASGTSEIINGEYRWHTVKLSGLQANTEYFYKAVSGSGTSKIYSFRTQPDQEYTGKIRFLLLSDTHADDTTMIVKILKEAKKKIQQLYGDDFQNNINLVLHSGDLVILGSEINQWTDQYFAPMSCISPYIPFMTITGNHERENRNYYAYMKYDDVSAYPDLLNEKFWSISIGNTAVIGLNSNISISSGTQQTAWLNQKLNEIESDPKIDFVIVLIHHMPLTELWGEGMSDIGSVYVRNQILPVLKKYSKVVQLSYGHAHGFERGTIESEAENSIADFRIVCGGGGGGILDLWGAYKNTDYPSIHISLDHYLFQIVEIDIANKTFECSMYSLGNQNKIRDVELMDRWYRKVYQSAPETPIATAPEFKGNKIIFTTSKISNDSLMTVRIQVSDESNFKNLIINSMIHWKNVYGVDDNFNPIDLNGNLDLTKLSFDRSLFMNEKLYYYKVKYRDHNLKWSNWSNVVAFTRPPDKTDDSYTAEYDLKQNSPNPFNSMTKIIYKVQQNVFVSLKVYDILGKEIKTLVDEDKLPGQYEVLFDGSELSSGVYFYKIQAGGYTLTKKLILLK